MHCRDKAFIVAERVYFKTQCIYISLLSRDTTLISSQMRSCYVFSLVSPPLRALVHSITLPRAWRGGSVSLSLYDIPCHAIVRSLFTLSRGLVDLERIECFRSQFNTGFTIQAIWLQQNVWNQRFSFQRRIAFLKERERESLCSSQRVFFLFRNNFLFDWLDQVRFSSSKFFSIFRSVLLLLDSDYFQNLQILIVKIFSVKCRHYCQLMVIYLII